MFVQAPQPAILVVLNFVRAAPSQVSSAASSGSLPIARAAWHLPSAPTSLATALPTLFSHLVIGPFGASEGTVPVSSPPNGVPASASAMLRARTTPLLGATVRNFIIILPA